MSRTLTAAAALWLALLALAPPAAHAQAATPTARVIVKFKADSTLAHKQALSAPEQHAGRAQALGLRTGLALTAGMGVGERSQVMFAKGMSSAALAERLARESDVEYAVPDQRKRLVAAPNDPRYTTVAGNGPAVGQWYLRAPSSTPGTVMAAINAEAAWDVTTGSNTVVVAVLDTGVRFDHPDLKKVADGGNFLDGYDMISDVDTANDGGGRDADASDPGDWFDQADVNGGKFAPDCGSGDISDSSWHGTQTAGLIGAITNNGVGMASVGRNVRILPVRVLGKCGGLDSDILAGMRWAAGIHIDGVPDNPNPAKVINMSLGGGSTCTAAYVSAVNEIIARGTVIVASAGNSAGHAVSEPASCSGVIGVAAIRHIGTKVGFSDAGPEVSLSAPGGNCVNDTGACLYPILTTSNAGTTTPGSSIYTDSFNTSIGTSFSAPLAAGTAALVLSAQSSLTPAEVRTLMRATSRPFPSSGAAASTPVCQAPTGTDQFECYCTTATCGAGMLDAGAAAAGALGLLAKISVGAAAPAVGEAITFDAQQSTAPTGRTINSYDWAITDAGSTGATLFGAAGTTASAATTAAGQFVVRLTITDSSGLQTSAMQVVTVSATSTPPSNGGDSGGGGGALDAGWLLALLAVVAWLAIVHRRGR
jgi:serine protease